MVCRASLWGVFMLHHHLRKEESDDRSCPKPGILMGRYWFVRHAYTSLNSGPHAGVADPHPWHAQLLEALDQVAVKMHVPASGTGDGSKDERLGRV